MKKEILFLLISIGFSCTAFSQVVNDAGLWLTFNLEKKINKRLELFATQEYRRNENFSRTNLFYTDLGTSFKPLGFLKISGSYRFIQKQLEDHSYSYRHRLMLDILLKKKIGKLTGSFRERIQAELRDIYCSEKGKLPEWYSRNKIELKYDLDKPFSPYAFVEFRYQLNNPRDVESDKMWHRVRYALGIDYKINDKNALAAYYLIQRGFNVSAPQNLYIIGLAYTLSL